MYFQRKKKNLQGNQRTKTEKYINDLLHIHQTQNHRYVSFTKLKQNQKAIKKHIILGPTYKIQNTNWFTNSCSKL